MWLDEGIASLAEEVDRQGRHLDNWRLVYIKQFEAGHDGYFTIDKILSYENNADQLLNTVHDCYSRYLCMFLEENGALDQVYRNAKAGTTKPADVAGQLKTLFQKDSQQVNLDFSAWLKNKQVPKKWNAAALLPVFCDFPLKINVPESNLKAGAAKQQTYFSILREAVATLLGYSLVNLSTRAIMPVVFPGQRYTSWQ